MQDSNIWDPFLTERDRQVFKASGFGAIGGFGKRPAFLIVDVSYAFCGHKREPILDWYKRKPIAWIGTGVAGVGLITGTVFSVLASNSRSAWVNAVTRWSTPSTFRRSNPGDARNRRSTRSASNSVKDVC